MPFSTERQDAPSPSSHAYRRLALAVMLVAPLALGGCGLFGGSDEDEAFEAIQSAAPKPCPTIGVLDGADRITVFNGSGQDLTDVIVKAEITKAVTKCEYNTDDYTISVDLAFNGGAEMGPAATSREMNLKGFLAVTRIDGTRVSKQLYDIPITFEDNSRQIRFLKSIEETVVPYTDARNGSHYEFLIGFQVTKDQLDYNKKLSTTGAK
ncbi:MAG: hypothetical protein Q7T44_12235 [Parvibaculum sp.]|nr:hypothetical protein [Parvibaculum sp.]